ncbi:hypothetical protein ZWY2020_012768 [Hordeum vulgare]|nr:hypothetical protein ZWY2020_012768 [Hordeum vulgare]
MANPEPPICMSLTVAARRVFDFKVEGYSVAKSMASGGKYFQSDTFTVGGYDWAMRLHALFHRVSFCLVCLSKIKSKVGVIFDCTLLEKSGRPSAAVLKRLSSEFSSCGQQEGCFFFMSGKKNSDHLQGDCFIVRCTISVM